ncbi:MAG: hypothetical protein HY302_13365, partial [Opitutae bacterium]|nr:hypothetical protein [Opitutae bacterium]
QLAAALETLHAAGVGHFAVTPDNVFVRPAPAGPDFVLGGFDAAEPLAQNGLIPIPVDPLNAPPETAGLFKHSPGPLLPAWDWWSLGRTVQEFILGRHVMTLMPGETVARLLRERINIPEALLFERDTGSLRAGAIELMPPLDPRTELLLRGLLTGAKEGRWGLAEVREWLAGAAPKERYLSPRQTRFFRLNGRGHTLAEAAQLLRSPAGRSQAVAQVFGVTRPDTLAFFYADTREQNRFFEQAVLLPEAPGLRAFPEELAREVAAEVALHTLSGGEFFWRGQPLAAAVRTLLGNVAEIGRACQELWALGSAVVAPLVKAHDFPAAQLLDELLKIAGEAETLATRHRWLRSGVKPDLAALWQLALEPESRLLELQRESRAAFACSTDAALDKIFQSARPGRSQLVLLAWTAREPARFGYLTHRDMKLRLLAERAQQGRQVAQVLFWRRLERALRAGPLLFGERGLLVIGGLTLLLLLAAHVPGPAGVALGLLPAAGLALLRFGFTRGQASLVARWAPGTAAWLWRDRAPRCAREATALAARINLAGTRAEASRRLTEINAEIVALAQPEPAVTVPWPPRPWGAWAAVAASWLAVAGLAAGSLRHAVRHPPAWTAHTRAWQKALHLTPSEAAGAAKDIKVSWPYKLVADSPFPPLTIGTDGVFEPTAPQLKAALARAHELVAPYKPETIGSLLAVYVPTDENHGGLLLFDGKKKSFVGNKGVLTSYIPAEKSWLQLGEKTAIFIAP